MVKVKALVSEWKLDIICGITASHLPTCYKMEETKVTEPKPTSKLDLPCWAAIVPHLPLGN